MADDIGQKMVRFSGQAPTGFLPDGQRSIEASNIPEIEERIARKYAGLLASAGLLRRFFIRRRMRAEIRRALDELAPRDALYCGRWFERRERADPSRKTNQP